MMEINPRDSNAFRLSNAVFHLREEGHGTGAPVLEMRVAPCLSGGDGDRMRDIISPESSLSLTPNHKSFRTQQYSEENLFWGDLVAFDE
ncbi:hypothetical protein CEXT_562591 [Caerostris extrusa]|uniref:Uncharacterized protein n=1 Tax=Caerostris extrusa TaxID=172846 RepID=A0AAV4XGZ8_CAEEX|nr:hypothetical protein CEXT_562591 [Caerostris extrusa]